MTMLFDEMSGVVLSANVDSGVDVCPHKDWYLVKDVHGIQVYRCAVRGCLYFRHVHRSSIRKFIEFLRALPKVPQVPVRGYYTIPYLAKAFKQDSRTIRNYYDVVEGLEINGQAKHFELDDSTVVIYRDDPKPLGPCSCGRSVVFTVGAGVAGAVIGAAAGGKYGAKEAALGAFLCGIGSALLGYTFDWIITQPYAVLGQSPIYGSPSHPPRPPHGLC